MDEEEPVASEPAWADDTWQEKVLETLALEAHLTWMTPEDGTTVVDGPPGK